MPGSMRRGEARSRARVTRDPCRYDPARAFISSESYLESTMNVPPPDAQLTAP
jgi:hypothetical protein